jgi:hypothetical protein
MIPSTTNKLLIAEDWKKIYQSFRNADFKSYDFETLRRTMIAYLRENYPEDFNDYIESSEYIALVDLIAFLGQNLSFRVDLNARENFLETAERRESILRLANLINYNVKRNIAAHGFLKILAVQTTDNVIDGNGINLANQTILWNDPTNTNWYEQFTTILNSTMDSTFVFGKPYSKAIISGVEHQQYRINSGSTTVPVYSFNGGVSGLSLSFELVSSTFDTTNLVYEEPPKTGTKFGYIYKNDNQGNSSNNTGFFVYFKQGRINSTTFTIDVPSANAVVGIDAPDINNDDVWLWQLDSGGNYGELWTKVTELVGTNIIYNSLSNKIRNVYSVQTRENDQIDLNFSDGSFGNLPKGQFKLFYRQSSGLAYTIKPEQMSNISITIPYTNKQGQSNTLSLTLGLQETINNSATSETNEDIKTKAPQAYYTQNRMVTAEDYNIAPLTASSDILKIKSINRVSSGVSKYFDLSDISGRYSSTNIFADDGILYRNPIENNFEFNFVNENEILGAIRNRLAPIVASESMRNFYIEYFPRVNTSSERFIWVQSQKNTNQSKGYFKTITGSVSVGEFSGNSLQYVYPGALIKFVPPSGSYFLPTGKITAISDKTTRSYKWIKTVNVIGDGSNNGIGLLDNGVGPITLTSNIPSTSIPIEIIPRFITTISSGLETEIVNICSSKRNLGLSFDVETRDWYIITDSNLDLNSPFSLFYQKDTTNIGKDNSWLVAFEWTGRNYKVRYRSLEYIFESVMETSFFVDKNKNNYDFVNNTIIKDRIEVLSVNTLAGVEPTILVSSTVATTATSIIRLPLQATQTIGNNTLKFNTTEGIIIDNHIVIHPNITTGFATVIAKNTNTVNLSQVLSGTISAATTLTFVATSTTITIVEDYKLYESTIDQVVTLGADLQWQIDSAVVESDGYINPSKVLISLFDADDNGEIDEPDSFSLIVNPTSTSLQTGYKDKFVYFKTLDDGDRYEIVDNSNNLITAYPNEKAVTDVLTPTDGQLFYFYNPDLNLVKYWSDSEQQFIFDPSYYAREGRKSLKFHYLHNSGQDRRLDPSKTNLIEIFLLTKSYDTEYRYWLSNRSGTEPLPPTSQYLEESFSSLLEPIKSISDELVFQPTQYKVLFGDIAASTLQATFKAVKNTLRTTSDNDIKTRILSAINSFFSIENWDFGQTFYFSELATYVMNQLTPDITNFVIVPKVDKGFGSLYEISCQSNEIFVNGATVGDIEVIPALTASELKSSSIVTTTSGS